MPDAIEPAGYRSYRGKERISHPYCKHRVFLSEGLPRSDLIVKSLADPAPKIELNQAGGQRYRKQAHLRGK